MSTNTSLIYKIFAPIISILPLKYKINILYFRRFYKLPNIKKPITFNEKIQWRKIYDHNPLYTIAADKIESKKYIEKKNLDIYIPKILWEGNDFGTLTIEELPQNYVFKANHASRTNLFITNGNHYKKNKLKQISAKWFKHDQYKTLGEWAYKDIKRKVFIEEYLDFNGKVPDDYKFFVFHGKVHFIQVDTGRFGSHKRNMYNEKWEDLNIDYSYPRVMPIPKKPNFLDDMIKYAEKIGEDFDFIRVDFYYYKNKITFGELTVYPGAGFEKLPSIEWDLEFGKYWKINEY